ncbi:MAG: hypothetical protein AAB968_00410 [Patescibacteria group bacterium]|mgnify:CR=1 FL=1
MCSIEHDFIKYKFFMLTNISTTLTPVLIIDVIGIITGIVAIITVNNLNKVLAGKLSSALKVFMWGIVFMILAFLYTVVFTRLMLLPKPAVDIHHLFMTLGMIFFIMSAKKFANLARMS